MLYVMASMVLCISLVCVLPFQMANISQRDQQFLSFIIFYSIIALTSPVQRFLFVVRIRSQSSLSRVGGIRYYPFPRRPLHNHRCPTRIRSLCRPPDWPRASRIDEAHPHLSGSSCCAGKSHGLPLRTVSINV